MERASTRCLGWRVLCSGRARIGQCVDTSVTANAVFQIKKWRNSNREGGEWVSPARPSGLPLHKAGRHTVPGPTRAFVRTAHNHAKSLRADVQNGPGVQLRRWGEEAAAQGTAAQSYTPLHATGLHTLPWPACAWAGP